MNPSTKTIPPHVSVMQLILGGMISGTVGALARLGVPDHLDAGPLSAEELAPKVGAQPGPLYRLMRACASVGVLAEGSEGKFSQTPMSAALRRSGPISLRGWAIMQSQEWHMRGWEHLEYCVRTGKQATEKIYGKAPFQLFEEMPGAAA